MLHLSSPLSLPRTHTIMLYFLSPPQMSIFSYLSSISACNALSYLILKMEGKNRTFPCLPLTKSTRMSVSVTIYPASCSITVEELPGTHLRPFVHEIPAPGPSPSYLVSLLQQPVCSSLYQCFFAYCIDLLKIQICSYILIFRKTFFDFTSLTNCHLCSSLP